MDDIELISFDTIHIFPIFMRKYDSNIEYDIDVVYSLWNYNWTRIKCIFGYYINKFT